MFTKRSLVVFAGLLLLSFFPLAMPKSYSVDEVRSPFFVSFPNQIGEWKGKDMELDEKVYQILETRNVLSRVYENSMGESVHLLLVGSHKDRRVAHPPEVCYLGSDYTITEESQKTLDLQSAGISKLPVKEFTAQDSEAGKDRQRVLYLYKVGKTYTSSYYTQQLRFALDRLARRESEILLIRLSSPSHSGSALNHQFLSEIISHI